MEFLNVEIEKGFFLIRELLSIYAVNEQKMPRRNPGHLNEWRIYILHVCIAMRRKSRAKKKTHGLLYIFVQYPIKMNFHIRVIRFRALLSV